MAALRIGSLSSTCRMTDRGTDQRRFKSSRLSLYSTGRLGYRLGAESIQIDTRIRLGR